MNVKNLSIASLFAILSLGAVVANAQDAVKPHTYMYGDHLTSPRCCRSSKGRGRAAASSNRA